MRLIGPVLAEILCVLCLFFRKDGVVVSVLDCLMSKWLKWFKNCESQTLTEMYYGPSTMRFLSFRRATAALQASAAIAVRCGDLNFLGLRVFRLRVGHSAWSQNCEFTVAPDVFDGFSKEEFATFADGEVVEAYSFAGASITPQS